MNGADITNRESTIQPIVRTCGERTTDRAINLLSEAFPEESVIVVKEAPFEEALRATYRAALDAGRDWTFVMDADVLPSPPDLRQAAAMCGSRNDDVFVFRGLVLDKFFGWPREVGNYFYRTKELAAAQELVPDAGTTVRPESFTIQAMNDRGHRMETFSDRVYAIHDFGQYRRDLFRKGFVYAGKHPAIEILMNDWYIKSASDGDFLVMLAGAISYQRTRGPVAIDVRLFPRDLSDLLAELGLSEKAGQSVGFPSEHVKAKILAWRPTPAFHAYEAFLGVWPQERSDLSLARLRALAGWTRRGVLRRTFASELNLLVRATRKPRWDRLFSKIDLAAFLCPPTQQEAAARHPTLDEGQPAG